MLYRRTGKISQVAEKQDGGKKYGEIFGVYTAINKAGMHAGKVNIFELCCGYEQTSMFGENRLNRAFAEDTVREEVGKLVQKEHEKFISEDSKLEWDVELEWDTEQPSKAHVSTNDDTYVDSSGSASIGERGFSVEAKNDAKYNANNTVNKNADIIIDINMGEKEFGNNIWHHEEGESEEESAKHKYDEKTVSLNLLKDSPEKIASVFGELAEKVPDDSLLVAVSTRYTQSALRSAVATSSYFTEYKKKHLSEYKKMLKTEDKTSADALYNLHIQELDNREDAYYELLDKATNDFLVEKLTPTIDQLIDSYNITRLISSVGYYSNYMGDVMIDIYANVLSKRGVSLGLSIDSSMYYKYSGTAVSA